MSNPIGDAYTAPKNRCRWTRYNPYVSRVEACRLPIKIPGRAYPPARKYCWLHQPNPPPTVRVWTRRGLDEAARAKRRTLPVIESTTLVGSRAIAGVGWAETAFQHEQAEQADELGWEPID